MTDTDPQQRAPAVAEAVIERRRGPSLVWLIPIVAALVGGFVAWRTFSERGPLVTIAFASAEGLEAGKTKIKYKDVELGVVESISLAPDLSGVVVRARMAKDADRFLHESTRFWVVRARVAAGQVSGLGTLFSGAYIGIDPAKDGKRTHEFRGLDTPPVVAIDTPGRYFVLHSFHAGAPEIGTPVYFRKVSVGQVVSSVLDPSGDFVAIRIFVHAPYDERVRTGSRFWNASGLDVEVSAEGVEVDTESVVSMLIGGIAFDAPDGDESKPAPQDAVFPLYRNRAATREQIYTQKVEWLLHFDQSVRGLVPGSPVEFQGIPVGQVRDIRLAFDRDRNRFRIPVVVEIEPERMGSWEPDPAVRRAALEKLVAAGMRAQLKSGNLLTGQLLVSLDMHEDAPPAQIAWSAPYPEFPTIPTPIEEITSNISQLVKKLEKLPVDQIGADLRASLMAARATMEQADRTLAATGDLVGAQSPVNTELRRALQELTDAARSLGLAADQLESQPQSILFGKERSK
jgi:paraquat-inducible protein B